MRELAKVADIPDNKGLRVQVDNKYLALFKVADEVYAINALCPHAGAFLDIGYFDGEIVTCALHGWDFNVTTGESPSFGVSVGCYDVIVEDGIVYLKD